MSAAPFGESHQRRILNAFLTIHRRLAELEALVSTGHCPSPFAQDVNDLSPTEVRVLVGHFARIREAMRSHLEACSIPLEVHQTSVRWVFQTNLMQVQVIVDDLGPRQLEGYGPLGEAGRAAARQIQEDLTRLLNRTRAYLNQGVGRDLSERLARLDAAAPDIRALAALERIVTRWRLLEYRPMLEMIAQRLESPTYEVAIFGRVSTGKSSLLNWVVGLDILPVGVTPVTAVPIRLEYGEALAVEVSFAEERPLAVPPERLWEYASEEGNPGNAKHVTAVRLAVPASRLQRGIVFVDTPGMGALAASGAAETLAYLPRCDLGIVLIDAASSLAADDLALLRLLYEAGAPAMVLLSKADLLQPADRQRMTSYLQEQLRAELGLDLPVSLVSVKGAEVALLERWFDAELGPLLQRHRELAEASVRRKLAGLREAVAAVLELQAGGRGGPHRAAVDHSHIRRLLDEADESIRAARDWWRQWLSDREPLLATILKSAARRIVASGRGSREDSRDWLAASIGEVMGHRAQTAHQIVSRLQEELGRQLEELRRLDPRTTAEVLLERDLKLDGLPLFDLEPFRVSREGMCPWWARFAPGLAAAAVEERIWQRFGNRISEGVVTYDRRLQAWSKSRIDEIVDRFEIQVAPVREQSRRLLGGTVEGDEAAASAEQLAADLRELRELDADPLENPDERGAAISAAARSR
jgi:GTP-binding protein EngB required for normal cell division